MRQGEIWLLEVPDMKSRPALVIQRAYLEACQRLLPLADLPEWASPVIDLWREALEELYRLKREASA